MTVRKGTGGFQRAENSRRWGPEIEMIFRQQFSGLYKLHKLPVPSELNIQHFINKHLNPKNCLFYKTFNTVHRHNGEELQLINNNIQCRHVCRICKQDYDVLQSVRFSYLWLRIIVDKNCTLTKHKLNFVRHGDGKIDFF